MNTSTEIFSVSYDVFNGDADGICALHQLRLANPKKSTLVTGVKREIQLLDRVPHHTRADVTVLDISLDTNVVALKRILADDGQVTYFDHHSAKHAFEHPRLQAFLDETPTVCTSILVDRHLQGRYRQWAIAAAFGDNLIDIGYKMANEIGLTDSHANALKQLGSMLNYNAYGESIEDLHVPPEELYHAVHSFEKPLDFIASAPQYRLLVDGYDDDEACLENIKPAWTSSYGAIYILPNARWAQRISGVLANRLVATGEERSYAVLTEKSDSSYLVSVRSGEPMSRAANVLCERFTSGGGRRLAAGINSLPATELDRFMKEFSQYFQDSMACSEAYDGHRT